MLWTGVGTLLPCWNALATASYPKRNTVFFLVEKHSRMCHNKSDGYEPERMIQRNPAGETDVTTKANQYEAAQAGREKPGQAEIDLTTKAEQYEEKVQEDSKLQKAEQYGTEGTGNSKQQKYKSR